MTLRPAPDRILVPEHTPAAAELPVRAMPLVTERQRVMALAARLVSGHRPVISRPVQACRHVMVVPHVLVRRRVPGHIPVLVETRVTGQ